MPRFTLGGYVMLQHLITPHFVTGFACGAAFTLCVLFVAACTSLAGAYDEWVSRAGPGTKR